MVMFYFYTNSTVYYTTIQRIPHTYNASYTHKYNIPWYVIVNIELDTASDIIFYIYIIVVIISMIITYYYCLCYSAAVVQVRCAHQLYAPRFRGYNESYNTITHFSLFVTAAPPCCGYMYVYIYIYTYLYERVIYSRLARGAVFQ